jgi:PLP dependent protein
MSESVAERVVKLKNKIEDFAAASGINSDSINLVAVSKKQPIHKIIEAQKTGIKYFGENKVQEFVDKCEIPEFKSDWHFIGHLQTNKIKYILGKVALIHSIDSLRLAEKISQMSIANNITTDFLLQVNTSKEDNKFGFDESQLMDELNEISQLRNISIKGLMTMAPFTDKTELISQSFAALRKLFEKISEMKINNIQMQFLSMGMSGDYEIAIKEGSNMLRIGTSIFGLRN